MVQACNPSYWGGRDWEEQSRKNEIQGQNGQKSQQDPILTIKAGRGGMCLSSQLYKEA
jgi:hypothetical protein